MNTIEIYTKNYCPFCIRAKAILNHLELPFTEYEVTGDSVKKQEMVQRTGGFTVPQIIINEHSIGGCDELTVLVRTARLEQYLTTDEQSNTEELENVA